MMRGIQKSWSQCSTTLTFSEIGTFLKKDGFVVLVEWHLVHRRYNIEWRVFHYGDTVYFAKIYFFARIFELIIQSIISGEWRGERERVQKETKCEGRGNEKERNPKRVGPAPSRRPHIVKDQIPLGCLDIGTVILIKAMSWAAVVSFYFECLSDFELISEFFLVFFPPLF